MKRGVFFMGTRGVGAENFFRSFAAQCTENSEMKKMEPPIINTRDAREANGASVFLSIRAATVMERVGGIFIIPVNNKDD